MREVNLPNCDVRKELQLFHQHVHGTDRLVKCDVAEEHEDGDRGDNLDG